MTNRSHAEIVQIMHKVTSILESKSSCTKYENDGTITLSGEIIGRWK